MDEISAGAGIGYFGMIWNIGQGGLNRGIVGGPSTLTEAISVALGDRVQLGAEVQEIVHKKDSVVVRYRQDGIDSEVEARCVVLATPATVAHRVAVDLPVDVREALGQVKYGPHVSAAFLTDETSARPVGRVVRDRLPEAVVRHRAEPGQHRPRHRVERQPGGSIMTFSPAGLGRALLDKTDEEIVAHPPGRSRPGSRLRLRRQRRRGQGVPLEGRLAVLLPRPRQAAADPDAPGQPGLPGRRLPRHPLHRVRHHHRLLGSPGSRQPAGHRAPAGPTLPRRRPPANQHRDTRLERTMHS